MYKCINPPIILKNPSSEVKCCFVLGSFSFIYLLGVLVSLFLVYYCYLIAGFLSMYCVLGNPIQEAEIGAGM